KAASIDSLFIDIGADDAATTATRVRLGDPAVIEQPILMLTDDRIAARGLDNRAGAFVAAEALRLLAEGDAPYADIYAVATVAVVSFPNRSMHSPNEVCSLVDLEHSARLLAATIRAIGPDTDFTPR